MTGRDESSRLKNAAHTTALVMATLSKHTPFLPEHVIKAAAAAAGAATVTSQRKSS